MSDAKPAKSLPAKVVDGLASYGLASLLLLLMCAVTYFGTIEQVDHGLFEVQNKYFNSVFLVHWLGGVVPIPLPGAALLMGLLAVNLTLGGLIRIRRSIHTAGVIVCHLGILLLIAAGLVTYVSAYEGSLALHKGEEKAEFTSYHHWELAVRPSQAGEVTEHVVPEAAFAGATPEQPRSLELEGVPATLRVTRWWKNSDPVLGTDVGPDDDAGPALDGFALKGLALDPEAERNIHGIYLTVVGEGGAELEQIVWGGSLHPWVVDLGGTPYEIELRREAYPLPFAVELTDFVQEQHPGTRMASNYESTVLRKQGGEQEEVHIKMNEPLRHEGFTLFQSEVRSDRDGVISVFAVVKNPADKWPEWACYIIAIGLAFHFGYKLIRYIQSQQAKRQGAAA